MRAFNTLVDAINDLKARGYNRDFNLRETYIQCSESGTQLSPDEFEIMEVYRFEGMTDPDDQTVLYAIEGKNGMKGVLVNAYGPGADPISQQLVAKLTIHK
jgi:hypothetical protein